MSLLILKFHSHDHQTDNVLRESRHDNSKPIIIASSATTTLSNIYSSHGQLYPTFILHSSYIIFTDHTKFHSHDHRTDNLLKESRHDNSRHITIASLVIIIPQLRHDNNKQITFFSGHTTFHSHDHQTDTLLRESRHDNSRQITIDDLDRDLKIEVWPSYRKRQTAVSGFTLSVCPYLGIKIRGW